MKLEARGANGPAEAKEIIAVIEAKEAYMTESNVQIYQVTINGREVTLTDNKKKAEILAHNIWAALDAYA